jgi:hypothetical protein
MLNSNLFVILNLGQLAIEEVGTKKLPKEIF